jgi:hypothetical protein
MVIDCWAVLDNAHLLDVRIVRGQDFPPAGAPRSGRSGFQKPVGHQINSSVRMTKKQPRPLPALASVH